MLKTSFHVEGYRRVIWPCFVDAAILAARKLLTSTTLRFIFHLVLCINVFKTSVQAVYGLGGLKSNRYNHEG